MAQKTRSRKAAEVTPERESIKADTQRNPSIRARGAFVAVIAVILFLSLVRLRVANVPLERDEGEYAYSGQLILQGIPPYQLAYNMKFPGTYYAYSLILAVFGQTDRGIHLGLLFVNAATILLVFFLSRRLLRDNSAAVVAAAAFGFLSVDRWIFGVFGHATHFVVLAATAGILVLLRAIESNKAFTFIGAGTLLGVSVLMKQNGIFFLAFGIVMAAWSALATTPRNFRNAAIRGMLVAAGGAIPIALLFALLFKQGVFDRFWFWTIQYAREYVSEMSGLDAFAQFADAVGKITQANAFIWIFGLAGGVMLWFTKWPSSIRIFATSYFGMALISLCPGFYFRPHYFILLLPAISLFCGIALLSLKRILNKSLSMQSASTLAAGIFVVTVGAYVLKEWDYLFTMPTRQLSRSIYGANPFVESPEIAKYIQSHTTANDRIAVLGSEPQIYFYANRKSATGYIYTYALMEQQKYSARMQDEMIQEVNAAQPKYIVYVTIPTSWLARSEKEKILTWSESYLNQCYNVVGLADMLSIDQTNWVWDANAAVYSPKSNYVVYTFEKKTNARCVAS